MEKIQQIEIEKIEPDPEQPRTEFDLDGLQELTNSIKSIGLLQPITVRSVNGHGKFQIIAGERRWRSMIELGWKEAPAIVVDGLTEIEAVKLQLSENITRRNLNPVEEARAYQRCLDRGIPLKDVSSAVGKEPKYIVWLIVILQARDDVLWAVSKGHISANVAGYIARLSDFNQMKVLKAMNDGLQASQAIMLTERLFAEECQIDMFPETKLTDQQLKAARKTRTALEQAGKALVDLLKIEESSPGTVGAAMESEAEATLEQIRQLKKGLGRLQTALKRKQVAGMKI